MLTIAPRFRASGFGWNESTPDSLLRGRYVILRTWKVQPPQTFDLFIPEHADIPFRLPAGDELWAEFSRTPGGYRPIRVEIRHKPTP